MCKMMGSLSAVLILLVPARSAEPWGTILGRVVYDGKGQLPVPRMKQIDRTLHPEYPAAIEDESVVINKQNGGLANVFVYLRSKPSKIHPGFAQSAPQEQTLRHLNYRFVPHALALWNKDPLEFRNEENTGVNVKYNSAKQGFNDLISPPGIKDAKNFLKKQFEIGENRPGSLADGIHNWMVGYLLVCDHPYCCVTDERGIFCIPNLPINEELEFVFWHERLEHSGHLKNIKSDVMTFTINDKSRLQTKLTQPVTDLGEFKVDPKLFEVSR